MKENIYLCIICAVVAALLFAPASAFTYLGNVTLTQGMTFSVDGGLHTESNTSALGALDVFSKTYDNGTGFDYVVTYDPSMGGYINAIGGVWGTTSAPWEFWNFYVNGNSSDYGASNYECGAGDVLVFAYGPWGANETTASDVVNITVEGIDPFPGWTGGVTLVNGTALDIDGHRESNTTAFAAFHEASQVDNFSYEYTYYDEWGFFVGPVGDVAYTPGPPQKYWQFWYNGAPSVTGMSGVQVEAGDVVELLYGPDPMDHGDAEYAISITIDDMLSFPGWEGTVALDNSTFLFSPSENPGAEYLVNNDTDLGALIQASEAGFFDFDTSDAWYSSYGTLSLDGICGQNGSSSYYWAVYINDAYAPMGLSGNRVEAGDVVRFTYTESATYNELTHVNITVSDVAGSTSPDEPTHGTGPNTATIRWSTEVTESPDGSPLIYDGKVYITTWPDMFFSETDQEMYLYSFDAGTGAAGWKNTLAEGYGSVAPLAVGAGKIFARGTNGVLYAVDALSGVTAWSAPLDDTALLTPWSDVNSGPCVWNDRLFVLSTLNGTLNVFSLDGDLMYQKETAGNITYFTTPVGNGNTVYFAGNGTHTLYAIDDLAYQERWNVTTIGLIRSSPVCGDGMVYFSTDDLLCAVNATDGSAEWSVPIGGTIGTPALKDGLLYVGETDGLHCYDAATGAEEWHFTSGKVSVSPTTDAANVYFATSNAAGTVYALDAGSGDEIWHYTQTAPTDGNWASFYSSSPATADGRLYIGGEYYNTVYCFGAAIPGVPAGGDSDDDGPAPAPTPTVSLTKLTLTPGTFAVNGESGKSYNVSTTTALGVLNAAGLSFVVDDGFYTEYGSLFVDAIGGIAGSGASGWMYMVNGGSPGTGANTYTLKTGDEVIWYWSESMSTTPAESEHVYGYKVTISTTTGTTGGDGDTESDVGETTTTGTSTVGQVSTIGLPSGASLTIDQDRMMLSVDMDATAGEDVRMEQNTLIVTRNDVTLYIRFVDFKEIRGVITGPVESIRVGTTPLEGEVQGMGHVTVSVGAELASMPFGARILTSVGGGPSLAETRDLLCSLPGAPYAEAVAYAIDVDTMNLVNGEDITAASMTIEMDAAWVNANGGAKNLRVVHIGNDGNVEIIVPTVRFEGNTAYIDVDSPAGFSSFVLIAAGEPPAAVPTSGAEQTADTTPAAEETEPTQTPFSMIGGLAGAGIAVLWWSGRHDRNKK
jgi:outer membrane protein assembly factor BamB